MKQQYKSINFRAEALDLITQINGIIEDYSSQDLKLSVRQLYYQLVARDVIPNTEASYKRIAGLINDGRLAGLIDWDIIEDRNRDIEMRTRWKSGAQIVRAAADSFHMDMWQNQYHRAFVIVEKAALAGVLETVCQQYDVPMLAARGYPSVSIVRELALGHFKPALLKGQEITVLHLGDHDPSGLDMTRDLTDRLGLFLPGLEVQIKRIALNMPQIELYRPPPNPAKVTDSRFASYTKEYGPESWELDALRPDYLRKLLEGEIKGIVDAGSWRVREAEVESIRAALTETADNWE
jgi:hypothetical protein